MKQYTSKELRNMWIKFYEERGHVNIGAVSLVSDGSTGAMFNVAGMQPLMPYLLGKKHQKGTRLCNVQGCVRTNDIDGIGDKSHLTFFEMMGSWSLGDYFKEERCKWSYELLTEGFGFAQDQIAATVFAGDENAPRDEEGAKFRIASGIKKENVFYLPAEDNWWGLEYGPCGPDSEMFFIKDVPPCGPDCKPGCSCGKYTEVGNDVFMQYEKHEDGHLTPLEKKNVDTGWGLERNLAFLNGVDDVYKTDLFSSVISYIEEKSGVKYESDERLTRSMRIIADHIRTAVMLIGDEAKLRPSNAGAGYVLRRLIRRAVRHGRLLNLKTEDYLNIAAMYMDDVYVEAYPNLKTNREFVLSELQKEIERFESTIENGMKEFVKILDAKKKEGLKEIPGSEAFYLYDTFGFPYELTEEMAMEEGISVSEEGFRLAMEEQKAKARENSSFSQKSKDEDLFESLGNDVKSAFVGYDKLEIEDEIAALADEERMVDSLHEGSHGTLVSANTPFYATMGGQKGDLGIILTANAEFKVSETVKLPEGRIGHIGTVTKGSLNKGDKIKMIVDKANRMSTSKNHSATHLLQAALREVLGDHVEQQGSYQDASRTRFDFSHSKPLTKEEITRVEDIVNEKISENIPVVTNVMSIDEAKKTGAMALFGEKYGDTVRVVSMGDFSKELCGGTHVSNTGVIRSFKILSESGVAAGVRRIEAITDLNVLNYYRNLENELNEAAKLLKTKPSGLNEKLTLLLSEVKSLNAEIESLKSKAAKDALGDVLNNVCEVKGVKLLKAAISGSDMNALRDLSDELSNKIGGGVIVLASETDGRVNLCVKAADDAIKKGVHAGNLIKEISVLVGGGGGGRPNMATAGGKNPLGIDAALEKAVSVLEAQIK